MRVGDGDVADARLQQDLRAGDAGGAGPGDDDPQVATARRPTTLAALRSAARTTIAVPCWSSCMTGMSSRSRSRASISKQRGRADVLEVDAAEGRRDRGDGLDDLSTSLVDSTIGTADRPPNSANRQALPSMTGSEAAGPMSPRPSTAEPSETTATTRGAQVKRRASSGSAAMALETRATPGRVGEREVGDRVDRPGRYHRQLAALVHRERRVVGEAVGALVLLGVVAAHGQRA